jgi:predicted metal-dependent enzyme (double-stranded beta helix superfamily)
MLGNEGIYTVRECAQSIITGIDGAGNDSGKLGAAIREPMRRLMARSDLLMLGVAREGNNVAQSYYLYLDDLMSILLFQVPKGKVIQPHDHGIWESLFVYRGRIKHTIYTRTDDGSVPGVAALDIVEDRVIERGDGAVVAPPADIHGFTALADDTFGITVVNGRYKADRHYYQPDERTYLIRPQRNAR